MIRPRDVSSGSPEFPLTWEILKEVFPVPNSDRRVHADLFAGIVDQQSLKEDSVFYAALLARMRADSTFLWLLNDRFLSSDRAKEKSKSFAVRVLRWFRKHAPDMEDSIDFFEGPEDMFAPESAERELHMMLRLAVRQPLKPAHASETTQLNELLIEESTADWKAQLIRLRQLVDHFDEPSGSAAEAIIAAGESLLKACNAFECLRVRQAEQTHIANEADRAVLRAVLEAQVSTESVTSLLRTLPIVDSTTLAKLRPVADQLTAVKAELSEITGEIARGVAVTQRLQNENDWVALAERARALGELKKSESEGARSIAMLLEQMKDIADAAVATIESPH